MSNFKCQISNVKYCTGQSLLEIVVAIGLVIVVATGITITTVNGLKNSQFSQNQSQSTKLAQEMIEKVKTVKSRNCKVTSSTDYYWYYSTGSETLVWDSVALNGVTGRTYTVNTSGCGLTSGSSVVDGVFTKKLTLRDESASTDKQIRVIAEVSWTDISGSHSSVQETILADY